ncbi:MAG: efflux RND transporter permease subunit [Syntrophales bacterium]|jgi:HAE1 family hydrophobic/amphiphilic exporter-1|nr:efflux RND transporter permease subunit [Syntrophales bacterium]MCK9527340.1 efflux RND transporter permease subunit [Syntrophales bacterium]MDX9921190.1 efflux RND transporter permease subunit [Syntrophales bacterium]
MTLPELSVKRKITVLMIILIIAFFGFLALSNLGLDMMPELEYPAVSVITSYEGVSSEDIENLITKPIEEVVGSVQNVKSVRSVSQEGLSAVIVEFEWGVTLDFAAQDVREKLAWLTDYLPEEADTPMVLKFSASDYPILYYGVTGMEDTRVLRTFLEDVVKPRLDRIEGVASVYIMGGLEREINIYIDRDKLRAFNLTIEAVVARLARENVNISGGRIIRKNREYLVRTMGEYRDMRSIRDTIVVMHDDTPVYVRDLAEVRDTYKEIRNRARTNHRPSVIVMIMKQAGKNTVTVSREIKATIEEMRPRMPEDLMFYPVMDQARIITQVTRNTGMNAFTGAVIAVIMVFLFLWNWRSTITIALAVPLSGITTAIGLYAFDYTLNIMTLGGMALGVGMLVDNAVVVIESIFRHREEGKPPDEAAARGAEEVGMAITTSTLTTISVFLPMVLASGMAGRLSRPLAVTVAMALMASLFVALTIVPMVSSVFASGKENGPGRTEARAGLVFDRIREWYRWALRWCLQRRVLVTATAVIVFIASLGSVSLLGREFMPSGDIPIISLRVNLPMGTTLDETDRIIRSLETIILEQPETLYCASFVGLSQEGKIEASWGAGPTGVNEGTVYVRLLDKELRVRSTQEITDSLRGRLPVIEGATFDFFDIQQLFTGGAGGMAPVEIKIFGSDLEVLQAVGDDVMARVSSVEGLRDIDTTLKIGRPELLVHIDRERASQAGLTVSQVAQTTRAALMGVVSTRYREAGDEYDVRVRYREQDRKTVEHLDNVTIMSPRGDHIPLYQVASVEDGLGPLTITREDRERKVTIQANTFQRDIGSIMDDISEKTADLALPPGYFIEYGGSYKDMREAFTSLFQAFLIALLLIYMIMAAQFESLRHPFVIMLTVPLSFIGVVLGLLLFGMSLSVPAFMGLLILAGVVVNNGIVMVDYINRLRRRGMDAFEAVVQGASVRLRPVMITTFTTVFGMLPMALSRTQGSELRSPMAVTVAFGLLLSMLLTLFVIPVVYATVDRIRTKEGGP